MSKYVTKQREEWNTGTATPCASECSFAEEHLDQLTTIFIPLGIRRVFKALDSKFPHDEWQLLLCGSKTSENGEDRVVITDYIVPKQEVGAATVTNLECVNKEVIEAKNIIATIHSHVNMGVTPSTVDEEKTHKSQINYHIIVNHRDDYSAVERVSLPCGLDHFIDCEVEYETSEEEKVEVKGVENIVASKFSPSRYVHKYPASQHFRDTHWDTGTSNPVDPYFVDPDGEHYDDFGRPLDFTKRHHALDQSMIGECYD